MSLSLLVGPVLRLGFGKIVADCFPVTIGGRVAVALIEALQDVGQRVTQVIINQNGKPWFIEMPGRGLVVSSDVKVSYCPPMKSCRWVQVCVCRSANLSDKSGFSYLGTIDVYDQTEFQSLETLVGQVKAKVRGGADGK